MMLRPGKILLILLIPVALYALAKGAMYFKAKSTVDDVVVSMANQADVRYADISTDLSGAVTVSGITVQPRGFDDSVSIDSVRVASDDPLVFLFGGDWTSGKDTPPDSLSFMVSGVSVPLESGFMQELAEGSGVGDDDPCRNGLKIEPPLLSKMGFDALTVDFDGGYRLDPAARTLSLDAHFDVRDVQGVTFTATLTDVDPEALVQGAPPQFNLGGFEMSLRVEPEFGRQALKVCAAGSDESIQAWGGKLAEQAIEEMRLGGIVLGDGLTRAVRDFYRDWGELKLVSRPEKPVGMMSMMFLPPDQLVDALALNLSLNSVPVTDTRFTIEKPDMAGLSALFGAEPEASPETQAKTPRRIIVRREYESISTGSLSRYVDHLVRLKPRGQPLREGLLKGIRDGEAVVEQTLHGGKYTVYVPLAEIDSAEALIQRQIGALQ
jgi:hypothetical protein